MPFSPDFNDVYQIAIKEACETAGAYCERVDEQIFTESMLHRVYNQISKADIIIADMTGKNPNVFYEVGYAHALDKTVILLTQKADDIPFDLKHFQHIIYSSIGPLRANLLTRVRYFIENPKRRMPQYSEAIVPSLYGTTLIQDRTTEVICPVNEHLEITNFSCDLYNPTQESIQPKSFEVGMVVQRIFEVMMKDNTGVNYLPDGRIITMYGEIDKIYPQGWAGVTTDLITSRVLPVCGQTFGGEVRIHTDHRYAVYPFRCTFLLDDVKVDRKRKSPSNPSKSRSKRK